jgi:hypothetical protein
MHCPYQHGKMEEDTGTNGTHYTCYHCRFNTFRFKKD